MANLSVDASVTEVAFNFLSQMSEGLIPNCSSVFNLEQHEKFFIENDTGFLNQDGDYFQLNWCLKCYEILNELYRNLNLSEDWSNLYLVTSSVVRVPPHWLLLCRVLLLWPVPAGAAMSPVPGVSTPGDSQSVTCQHGQSVTGAGTQVPARLHRDGSDQPRLPPDHSVRVLCSAGPLQPPRQDRHQQRCLYISGHTLSDNRVQHPAISLSLLYRAGIFGNTIHFIVLFFPLFKIWHNFEIPGRTL